MTGQLRVAGDDGEARCIHCGNPAVGPCASCHQPVCGDCCTLTDGGLKTWAICLECDRRGGRSLRHGWTGVLVWLAVPILLLVGVFALLLWLKSR